MSIRTSILEHPPDAIAPTDITPAEADFHAPFPELLLEDTPLAIIIFTADESRKRGQPVAVIELLSPTNKQGSGTTAYQQKRIQLLRAGIALVEVDYLHETPSPIPTMPAYPDHADSLPYAIAVSNPTIQQTDAYRFGINQAMPTVAIPLLGNDKVVCDFDKVYQFTFSEGFAAEVDYNLPPVRLKTYSVADQQAIEQHMLLLSQERGALED